MDRNMQWKLLDNYRRKLFLKNEIKKKILNGLIKNQNLPILYRHLAVYNKHKLIRFGSIAQQQNRCVRTGRIWSVSKLTRYSRFAFRTESYKGNIPGFSRASW